MIPPGLPKSGKFADLTRLRGATATGAKFRRKVVCRRETIQSVVNGDSSGCIHMENGSPIRLIATGVQPGRNGSSKV